MTATFEAITRTIDDLLAAGRAAGDGGKVIDIRDVAVSAGSGRVLEETARILAPAACLEIGCASAMSTLHLCRGRLRAGAVPEGSMHVVDPWQEKLWRNIGRRALERAGLFPGTVVLHERTAHAALPRLLEERLRVRLVFVDGWHTLDHTMVEAFYSDRMLDVGGVMAFHDLWMPGLQAFASFWVANRAYEPVTLRDGDLVPEPAEDPRPVGDPERAFPGFPERLAPYVDESVLLLRKTNVDLRKWDEFTPFWG